MCTDRSERPFAWCSWCLWRLGFEVSSMWFWGCSVFQSLKKFQIPSFFNEYSAIRCVVLSVLWCNLMRSYYRRLILCPGKPCIHFEPEHEKATNMSALYREVLNLNYIRGSFREFKHLQCQMIMLIFWLNWISGIVPAFLFLVQTP